MVHSRESEVQLAIRTALFTTRSALELHISTHSTENLVTPSTPCVNLQGKCTPTSHRNGIRTQRSGMADDSGHVTNNLRTVHLAGESPSLNTPRRMGHIPGLCRTKDIFHRDYGASNEFGAGTTERSSQRVSIPSGPAGKSSYPQ